MKKADVVLGPARSRPVRRRALSWVLAYGPAVAWFAFAAWRYGPRLGYGAALGFGLGIGVGILGLTALFLAFFPATVERLGWKRLGAWLRTWWDEDAR